MIMKPELQALGLADLSSTLERTGSWSFYQRIFVRVSGPDRPEIVLRIAGSNPYARPYELATVEAAASVVGTRIWPEVEAGSLTTTVLAVADLVSDGWWRVLDSQAGAVWWLHDGGAPRDQVRDMVATRYPGNPSQGMRVALTARPAALL